MRLHTAALAAGLMAATAPSLTIPAEAWGGGGYSYFPDCGYGYWGYGHVLIYSYGCDYPAYREHRYAFRPYIGRRTYAAVRGIRRVRASSGAPAALGPSVAPHSVASPSVASPSTPTVQPASPVSEPSIQVGSTAKELQQAKVDAINARAADSIAQHKLADTEANLKQAKDEAARATKEAQQAKAEAQAARQSKAEAERKLAESGAARMATEEQKQSQADPLGTWMRGLGTRWLQGLGWWLRRWGLVS